MPTLTATPDDLVAPPTVLLQGAGFDPATLVLVTWFAGGTLDNAQDTVRGGAYVTTDTAGAFTLTDTEPPLGVPTSYTATEVDEFGNRLDPTVEATVDATVTWDGPVLFSDHFAQAAASATVLTEAEQGTEDPGQDHYPFGASTPVVLRTAGAGTTGSWVLLTTTVSQRQNLLSVLRTQPLVLVRPPGAGYDWPTKLTVAIGAVSVARWSDNAADQRRRITVSYTVQDSPGPSFAGV